MHRFTGLLPDLLKKKKKPCKPKFKGRGSGRGGHRWLPLPLARRLWVLQVYEVGVHDFVARVHENVKKPVIIDLQG